METDRQFNVNDLLGIFLTITGADEESTMAIPLRRWRRAAVPALKQYDMVFHRIGLARGGVGILTALMFVLGLMWARPRATAADGAEIWPLPDAGIAAKTSQQDADDL